MEDEFISITRRRRSGLSYMQTTGYLNNNYKKLPDYMKSKAKSTTDKTSAKSINISISEKDYLKLRENILYLTEKYLGITKGNFGPTISGKKYLVDAIMDKLLPEFIGVGTTVKIKKLPIDMKGTEDVNDVIGTVESYDMDYDSGEVYAYSVKFVLDGKEYLKWIDRKNIEMAK